VRLKPDKPSWGAPKIRDPALSGRAHAGDQHGPSLSKPHTISTQPFSAERAPYLAAVVASSVECHADSLGRRRTGPFGAAHNDAVTHEISEVVGAAA
jgi:hypothetical protein